MKIYKSAKTHIFILKKIFCLDFKKWYCIRGHNHFDYFDKSSGIRDIFNFIPMIGRAYFSFLGISFKR